MTFRTLPPSGVPFKVMDIAHGFMAMFRGEKSLRDFQADVSGRFGKRHVFLYSSGRGAISEGLQALRALYPDRDEVAVPAFTSFSVPSAVVHAGLKVSLYDVDRETLSPDPESLKRAVSDKTLCILVCHLFGCPADMGTVAEIAREAGVPLFDDAAQAMGATLNGEQAGAFGDLGLFSLSRGKNISAVDGGVLVTDRDDLAAALAAHPPRNAGWKVGGKMVFMAIVLSGLLHPRLYWIPDRLPFLKLGESHFDPDFPIVGFTPFQAGLARRMLARLDRINSARKRVAADWMSLIRRRKFPRLVPGGESVWLRLPLIDGAGRSLRVYGVVRSYPTALHAIEGLRNHLKRHGPMPGAEFLARNIVTLPTHAYVTRNDIEGIAVALSEGDGQ